MPFDLSKLFLPIFTFIFGLFVLFGLFQFMGGIQEGMDSVIYPNSSGTFTQKSNF
jgi:hypothetical protein